MQEKTIYDIAKMAGVSAATVSRVINNYEYVNPATREKVLKLLEENKFVLNETARSLSTQSTKIIGILIADIRTTQHTDAIYYFTHEFYRQGYACLIYNTGPDPERQAEFIQLISQRKIEAVILIGSIFQNESVKKALESYLPSIPVGMCNGYLEGRNIYCVISQEREGVCETVRMLASKGRRRIAYISNNLTASNQNKLEGYRDGINSYCDGEEMVEIAGEDKDSIARITLDFARRGADAIIYSEDNLALIGMRALNTNSYCVPQDVAVAGINNSFYSENSIPSLTSIDNMLYKTSVLVSENVIRAIGGQSAEHLVSLPVSIVERESTL